MATMSHIGDGFHRRHGAHDDGMVVAMRTKISILSIALLLFVLLSGCIVRTHRGPGYYKRGRGCPDGWVSNNNKCYKKGPPPGHVKTRDHR